MEQKSMLSVKPVCRPRVHKFNDTPPPDYPNASWSWTPETVSRLIAHAKEVAKDRAEQRKKQPPHLRDGS